jgi:hypothetical protein
MEHHDGTKGWLGAQLTLIGFASLLLVGWPPRTGALMLVPMGERAAARTVQIALASDALLLGSGPLPRSFIVRGDRDRLARTMLAAGILVLAAPSAGCGTQDAQA